VVAREGGVGRVRDEQMYPVANKRARFKEHVFEHEIEPISEQAGKSYPQDQRTPFCRILASSGRSGRFRQDN
jgi:hypothetical protein